MHGCLQADQTDWGKHHRASAKPSPEQVLFDAKVAYNLQNNLGHLNGGFAIQSKKVGSEWLTRPALDGPEDPVNCLGKR